MNVRTHRPRRRAATMVAVGVLFGLPTAALFVGAPAHAATSSSAGPASDLGGLNTTATAAAVEVAPLTPGVVPAGNLSKGDVIHVSIPYATSSTSTGPTSSGTAAPAYPGQTAAGAGTAFQTLSPSFPASLANLMNDHAQAQSSYPSQVGIGTSGSYSPAGPAPIGLATANTQSGPSATQSTSDITDTTLGSGAQTVEVASSKVTTAANIEAASVSTEARTVISGITIAGAIKINGLLSDAVASSDGSSGQGKGTLKLGDVTVDGVPASIGPSGIQLDKNSVSLPVFTLANSALQALEQAGLSVTTISPTEEQNGTLASVTSGALQVTFLDAHVPSLQGRVPISSIGLEFDIGLTQASADATALPPFPNLPSTGFGSPASSPSAAVQGGVSVPPSSGSSGQTISITTPGSASTGSANNSIPSSYGPSISQLPSDQTVPASFIGLPVQVGWVVVAFLLSLVAAGPLLAYANWQLLRGRAT